MAKHDTMSDTAWIQDSDCGIDEFKRHVEQEALPQHYPSAAEIADNIPVYDGRALDRLFSTESDARMVMAEMNRSFLSGPGIVAIRGGYDDLSLIDAVTEELEAIIEEEEAAGTGTGDHFAEAGSNSRLWNAHEKLCMRAPELFIRYNSSEILRRVCESWLGPAYQITTQVNVVRPGGKAQVAHRDYHMGFQSTEVLQCYPASQHALSAALTLQGAVAHCDMPIESGPTRMLPFSQSFAAGYIAVHRPEIRAYFDDHFVQLPLEKGDMLFFNPATFHAAGDNRTNDVHRIANLMQIGSGYGRSIEIVDRCRISKQVFPVLSELNKSGALTERQVDNVVAATAEGYPFPVNLDLDSPLSGMAPPSQQDIMRQALNEGWTSDRFAGAIAEQQERRRSF